MLDYQLSQTHNLNCASLQTGVVHKDPQFKFSPCGCWWPRGRGGAVHKEGERDPEGAPPRRAKGPWKTRSPPLVTHKQYHLT